MQIHVENSTYLWNTSHPEFTLLSYNYIQIGYKKIQSFDREKFVVQYVLYPAEICFKYEGNNKTI